MAFAAETVTTAKHGLGPLQLKYGTTPTLLGRVISFSIEFGDGTWHEIRGGSPDQVVDLFEASKATGNIQVTIDEIVDLDATTIVGKQVTITLEQEFPTAGASASWKMSAATAVVKAGTMAGDRTGTTDSTQTFTIMPYAAVASDPWTFSNTETP